MFVEESLKSNSSETAPELVYSKVNDSIKEAEPRTDTGLQEADSSGSAEKVLTVAANIGQFVVQFSIALGSALWRFAKWSFHAVRGLVTKVKERTKSSE